MNPVYTEFELDQFDQDELLDPRVHKVSESQTTKKPNRLTKEEGDKNGTHIQSW